eukprot:2980425-Pleurochrysis_carterae.AAC.1
MRTGESLRRRLLSFDRTNVPKAAARRLQSFFDSRAPDAEQAVAAAVHAWVCALLRYDGAADDAKASAQESSCSTAMQAACECVCDLYGLEKVTDDLRGVLLMADRFPEIEESCSLEQPSAETAQEQQLEGLQQKVFRLKQFIQMLQKDMEASAGSAQPKREDMRAKAGKLNDRCKAAPGPSWTFGR